jgi:predicted O-methyltransferase YrrM
MILTNLNSIKFIGDLSLQDADVLAKYGRQSKSILEFGVGGSTQILSQCGSESFTSIETDPEWIALTSKRLEQIVEKTPVLFYAYDDVDTVIANKQYDLIFVDGIPSLRRDFALRTWKNLKPNGVMIFHDTRRKQDFANAMHLTSNYFNEISIIEVNARASNNKSSNMTVIHKKELEPYVNWNYAENKPMWAYGGQPNTDDFPLWSQES